MWFVQERRPMRAFDLFQKYRGRCNLESIAWIPKSLKLGTRVPVSKNAVVSIETKVSISEQPTMKRPLDKHADPAEL
jgi:hypothetical protein